MAKKQYLYSIYLKDAFKLIFAFTIDYFEIICYYFIKYHINNFTRKLAYEKQKAENTYNKK
ncbi:MAG: hypothetical protein CVU97_04240 [Firmicutes bacterium HGW-Firmicutes-21]|nr:MAG: hypothetical protein CVU97_04240 [Firmicutes bacterium HGW-Firmicutes-21]